MFSSPMKTRSHAGAGAFSMKFGILVAQRIDLDGEA